MEKNIAINVKEYKNYMEDLVSVIVPIYNVENYLSQCIESIIKQTYKNLEIILVDDGSPDNCGSICDEYAAKDERIHVVHKKNGGLSDARNAGMQIMSGEFLMFVDSDDWLQNDCIEILYGIQKKYMADLVIGGVQKIEDVTGNIIWSTENATPLEYTYDSNEEAMKDMFINGCASWARLYKKSIHEGIWFPKGEINEDEAIVLKIMDRCEKIVKTNHVIYNYRFRTESITSTKWNLKKLDWYEHCKNNLKYVEKKYPSLKEVAQARYISSLIWVLNNMTVDTKMYRDYIESYRRELRVVIKHSNWKKILRKKEIIRAYFLTYMYYVYAKAINLFGKHYT